MDELLEKTIRLVGGPSELARGLGIDRSNVSLWRSGRKQVPYRHRIAIEAMTDGQIRAVDWECVSDGDSPSVELAAS